MPFLVKFDIATQPYLLDFRTPFIIPSRRRTTPNDSMNRSATFPRSVLFFAILLPLDATVHRRSGARCTLSMAAEPHALAELERLSFQVSGT
jgi:hypothetical protein